MVATAYPKRKKKSIFRRIWDNRAAYLFITPFFIGFLLLDAFPLAFSGYLSLHKWNGLGEMRYRGPANYTRAFQDSRFLVSLKNTATLWLGHIFLLLALAFILAVVLNSKLIKGRYVYRVIYYLPNITAIAPMALVFGLIFDTHFGILNLGLTALGITGPPWLTEPFWANVSIIILNIWSALGWYMLILLAGLQSIDPTLYEAAQVDGSTTLQRAWYITLPGLRDVLFFAFIIETIGSFELFTEPQLLTNGGPLNSTLTASLYLYNSAFSYNKFGYSSAMSFILFAIIVVVTIIQARLTAEDEA